MTLIIDLTDMTTTELDEALGKVAMLTTTIHPNPETDVSGGNRG